MTTTLNPFKVNLEKSLIKQNKKLITPEELLILNEYDKLTNLVEEESNTLKRIGLDTNFIQGKSIKDSLSRKTEDTKQFNQERVFHISQIESICQKYYLRFLPINRYKGSVDKLLPSKVTNFEIAYDKKCMQQNLMIIAPAESFKLEKKPVDPLLFYQINSEYYYLIHKWGNDLNIFRRFKALLSSIYISAIVFYIVALPLLLINTIPYFAITGIYTAFTLIFNAIQKNNGDPDRIRFHKTNRNWNNQYEM